METISLLLIVPFLTNTSIKLQEVLGTWKDYPKILVNLNINSPDSLEVNLDHRFSNSGQFWGNLSLYIEFPIEKVQYY